MELIREIIIPTQSTYTLNIPESMIGKEIEVLAFEIENQTISKPTVDGYEDFLLSLTNLKADLSNFKFNRDEANDYE